MFAGEQPAQHGWVDRLSGYVGMGFRLLAAVIPPVLQQDDVGGLLAVHNHRGGKELSVPCPPPGQL